MSLGWLDAWRQVCMYGCMDAGWMDGWMSSLLQDRHQSLLAYGRKVMEEQGVVFSDSNSAGDRGSAAADAAVPPAPDDGLTTHVRPPEASSS